MALLIEVADTSLRYDRHVKGPLDAEAGVRDYWIVDLDGVAVEVHRDPAEGAFRLTERVARGGALTPLAFGDISFHGRRDARLTHHRCISRRPIAYATTTHRRL